MPQYVLHAAGLNNPFLW